jgi:pimeloyl-ACP methyl ester carboxylesterase
MWKSRLVVSVLVIAVTSIGLHAQEASPTPVLAGDLTEADLALFDYDADAPLELTEIGEEIEDGDVAVKDITYLSVDGESVTAYLVVPPGEGPFPAVLWVHGFGSNRQSFLNEAVDLAVSNGVVSLLIEELWTDPNWLSTSREFETDYEDNIGHVVGLRRAIDVLESQPFVDPARIGFVGRDMGGTFGATLAGVDHRAKAYVLIAANSNFVNWIIRSGRETFALQDYLVQMDSIAALRFIPNAAPSAVFFQFNQNDQYTQPADNDVLFDAASEPKQRATYNFAQRDTRTALPADRQQFFRDFLIAPDAED